MQQCIGQHGDDAGDVGEEEQIDDENRQEGQYLPDDLLQANFADAGGDEEVHADGRGDLADGEVDDHDNTEEGLIDAIGADQRDQNGGEQGDGGDIIQEGASHKQRQVNEQQNDSGAIGNAADGSNDLIGDLLHGEHPAEYGSRTDEEQDHRGADAGLDTGLIGFLDIELLKHKVANDETVQNGYAGGFGSGELAAVNTAQDDDRGQQRQEALNNDLGLALGMELSDIQLGGAVAVSLGAEVLDDHKAEAHDDAGDDTAGEHLQDGDIGDDGIHEHGAAGRNNEAQQTGGSDNSCGIFFLITGFFHGLYHDAADGSGRSGSGTGDSVNLLII